MRRELANPKMEAQVLRHDLGLSGPPDLPAVLQSLGVVLKEADMDDGFDGAALRTPKRNGILINKSVRYSSRRRFTIAHELGHLRLPWHDGKEYRCQSADIESFNPDRRYEREADEFAAEFLIPEAIIQPVFRKQQFSFNLIKAVADEYETSLTATALRGITYTPDRFAVVLSMDRRIRWGRRSESFGYSVRAGSLHHDTYAADFFGNFLCLRQIHVQHCYLHARCCQCPRRCRAQPLLAGRRCHSAIGCCTTTSPMRCCCRRCG